MVQKVRSPLIGTANITGNLIGVGAVTSNHIVTNSITGNLIPAGAISSNHIVSGGVTGNLIAVGAVTTNHIVTNSITGNLIPAGAISSNHIVTGGVTGNLLGLTSVSSNNIISNVSLNTSRIVETVNISPQAATGTITINVLDSAIHYYQGNVVSNVTVNLRGNSTAALGSVLNVGQSSSVAILIPIGGTQYVIQTIQIDGVAQTVRWGGNTKPAYNAGIGNAFTDSYSIIAIKETPSSYIVLASNTAFGVGA